MKKSTIAYILILVLSIALAGSVGYIIRDKVVSKTDNDTTSKTNSSVSTNQNTYTTTYEKIIFEIVKDPSDSEGNTEYLKIDGKECKDIYHWLGFSNVKILLI